MTLSIINFLLVTCVACHLKADISWGFEPHRLINRYAVFTLPPSMLQFYKHHINYLSAEAVAADHRRYVLDNEAPRHYIDLDYYGENVPVYWNELCETYPIDSIHEHGILPWNLNALKSRLTEAFRQVDVKNILKLSADGGHYLADGHVPLHTCSNYNGQFTGQHGIHGFWETRIPELLIKEFDLWVGQASYQENWYSSLWEALWQSFNCVDSVLRTDRELTRHFGQSMKYSYEVRLSTFKKVYSESFSRRYNELLDKQVEKRFRASIQAVGNFWYTCWIDAGQPELPIDSKLQPFDNEYLKDADSIWLQQHRKRKY